MKDANASEGLRGLRREIAFLFVLVFGLSLWGNASYLFDDPSARRFIPPFDVKVDGNLNDLLGAEYRNIAVALAHGRGFSDPFGEPTGPTAWMPPVYPAILAVFVKLCDWNRPLVVAIIVVLKGLVLVLTGVTVLLGVRASPRGLPLWVAVGLYTVWLIAHYWWLFQQTHDVWLLMLFIDLSLLGVWFYLHEKASPWRYAAWGLFGGVQFLTSPVVGLAWIVLTAVHGLRERRYAATFAACVIAATCCSGWVIRNALVFDRLIFIKSNLHFDLLAGSYLAKDGVYDEEFFLRHHPYARAIRKPGTFRYRKEGELGYIDRYKRNFLMNFKRNPGHYFNNVKNRLMAATWKHKVYSEHESFGALTTVVRPLPVLGLVLALIAGRVHRSRIAITAVVLWTAYLTPYIAVAYYARYLLPLTPILVLAMFWGTDVLAAFVRRLRARAVAASAMAAACVFTSACSRPDETQTPPGRYNVLLVTLDTTRRDHLSLYGYERKTTPRIDELGAESLVYTRAVATSNWTLPTHASMLSGLYSKSHGAHSASQGEEQITVNPNHPATAMSPSCETLAEVLEGNDYRTGAIVANHWWLKRQFQLDQGFGEYHASPASPRGGEKYPTRTADEIADEALEWIDKGKFMPFFLLLNFLDAHAPYAPPPPYDDMFMPPELADLAGTIVERHSVLRNAKDHDGPALKPDELALVLSRYDGELAFVDAQVGRVLDGLREADRYDDTLIIITGDHGEAFGEHEIMGHTHRLFEPEIAVPMLVKLPGQVHIGMREHRVSHVDIMPTVLGVLGIEVPAAVQGRSMLKPRERIVITESHPKVWEPLFQRAIYHDDRKLISYSDGRRELFNLKSDGAEAHNLLDEQPDAAEKLQALLDAWDQVTVPSGDAQPVELSDEDIELLRDIGYIQ